MEDLPVTIEIPVSLTLMGELLLVEVGDILGSKDLQKGRRKYIVQENKGILNQAFENSLSQAMEAQ